MSKNTKTVLILLAAAILIAVVRTARRGGKSDFLCADRNRRGRHCIFYGPFCGTEEVDERGTG